MVLGFFYLSQFFSQQTFDFCYQSPHRMKSPHAPSTHRLFLSLYASSDNSPVSPLSPFLPFSPLSWPRGGHNSLLSLPPPGSLCKVRHSSISFLPLLYELTLWIRLFGTLLPIFSHHCAIFLTRASAPLAFLFFSFVE